MLVEALLWDNGGSCRRLWGLGQRGWLARDSAQPPLPACAGMRATRWLTLPARLVLAPAWGRGAPMGATHSALPAVPNAEPCSGQLGPAAVCRHRPSPPDHHANTHARLPLKRPGPCPTAAGWPRQGAGAGRPWGAWAGGARLCMRAAGAGRPFQLRACASVSARGPGTCSEGDCHLGFIRRNRTIASHAGQAGPSLDRDARLAIRRPNWESSGFPTPAVRGLLLFHPKTTHPPTRCRVNLSHKAPRGPARYPNPAACPVGEPSRAEPRRGGPRVA